MEWWRIVLVAAAIGAVMVSPLALLWLRRRWLMGAGGLFDCCLRLRTPSRRSSGWVIGVARYTAEYLEWFPVFSPSFRPRVRIHRPDAQIKGQREPDPSEMDALYEGSRILIVTSMWGDKWELAMSPASLTGLISWLESAPPGVRYLPSD